MHVLAKRISSERRKHQMGMQQTQLDEVFQLDNVFNEVESEVN
jgi:hypothetical protein